MEPAVFRPPGVARRCRAPRRAPLFYLKGIRRELLSHRPDYLYFLRGEFREEGSRSYLLVAWLVTTPLPSLVLQAAAIPAFLRGRRAGWLDEAILIVPALAYALGYSLFADNLGVRYLIPAFPFLFVFAGRLVVGGMRPPRWRAAVSRPTPMMRLSPVRR